MKLLDPKITIDIVASPRSNDPGLAQALYLREAKPSKSPRSSQVSAPSIGGAELYEMGVAEYLIGLATDGTDPIVG